MGDQAEDDILQEAIRRSLIDVENGGYSEADLYHTTEDFNFSHQQTGLYEAELENVERTYVPPIIDPNQVQPQTDLSPRQLWHANRQTPEEKWLELHPEYKNHIDFEDCCEIRHLIRLGKTDDCRYKILIQYEANSTKLLSTNRLGTARKEKQESFMENRIKHDRVLSSLTEGSDSSESDKKKLVSKTLGILFNKKDDDDSDENSNFKPSRKLNNTPFHIAAIKNHENCIKAFTRKFPQLVDSQNMYGETALFAACRHGCIEAVKALITADADHTLRTCQLRNSETPLFAAVHYGSIPAETRANKENYGRKAPMTAYEEIIDVMVEYGAKGDAPQMRGWTPIHEAATHSSGANTNILRNLITRSTKHINLDLEDDHGITPLFSAVGVNNSQAVELLIQYGCKVDFLTTTKPESSLHQAVVRGYIEVVKTLVKFGANVHLKNHRGMMALHIACEQGHKEIVDYLLTVTDRDIAERADRSPLHCIADIVQIGSYANTEYEKYELAESLLDCGYNVNLKLKVRDSQMYPDRRETALFFAVYHDDEDLVDTLLEYGADPNIDAIPAVYMAIIRGSMELVEVLLQAGAELKFRLGPKKYEFPASIALALANHKMLTMILKWSDHEDNKRCFSCCDDKDCSESRYTDKNYKLMLLPDYNDDHSRNDIEGLNTKFCQYMTSPKQRRTLGYTIRLILEFTSGQPRLCNRLISALKTTDDWTEIEFMLKNPRKLQEIARFQVRKQEVSRSKLVSRHKVELMQTYFGTYEEVLTGRNVRVESIEDHKLPEVLTNFLHYDFLES